MTAQLAGETAVGPSQLSSTCSFGFTADRTYHLDGGPAALVRVLSTSTTTLALAARTTCTEFGSETACLRADAPGAARMYFALDDGIPATLIVEPAFTGTPATPFELSTDRRPLVTESEPNPDANPEPLALRAARLGSIAPAWDTDAYAFTIAEPAAAVRISVVPAAGQTCADVPAALILSGPGGVVSWAYVHTNPCVDQVQPGVVGTYTVTVLNASTCPGCVFDYVLTVETD